MEYYLDTLIRSQYMTGGGGGVALNPRIQSRVRQILEIFLGQPVTL